MLARSLATGAWVAALAAIAGLAHGCGGKSACSTNDDCGSTDVCSFPLGNCSAKGQCASWDNRCEGPPTQACACDGQTVGVLCGYPGQPVPMRALGACAVPVGMPCASPDDCDPRALCAYPIADGCNAKGVCVTADVGCSNDGPMACACDGTPVGLACIYGQGNAPAPIRSMTACARDGGGD